MEINVHFEIIEYSKHGFGRRNEKFPTLEKAIDWVNKAQAEADAKGNPDDLCYNVVPSGNAVYSSVPKVIVLDAVA